MVCCVGNRCEYAFITCKMCNRRFLITYNREDMLSWLTRSEFIQDAMPYLTDGERELLISQTCSDCFDILFPPLEETVDNDD